LEDFEEQIQQLLGGVESALTLELPKLKGTERIEVNTLIIIQKMKRID
jgi:hypothetical protein